MDAWKVHPEFRDYAVSVDGEVRRITRKRGARVGRVLRQTTTPFGYKVVGVAGKVRFVHVLVLETFCGPRLAGMESRHLNDRKTDNCLANLEWGTHAENYADRVRHGGGNAGARHGMSRLTESQVIAIRAAYRPPFVTQKDVAQKFGICREWVGKLVRRQRWAHL